MNLLANLLLPDSIPDYVEWVLFVSLIPILLSSLFGVRLTASPFRWRRVFGAIFGVIIGVLFLPFAMGFSVLLVNLTVRFAGFSYPPVAGFVIANILIILMTSSVAYAASRIGRPAKAGPELTMETLSQNLLEIEELVRSSLQRLDAQGDSDFDIRAAQVFGILTPDQATRMEEIVRTKNRLQRARSVLHSDVEACARKSSELLAEIKIQAGAIGKPTIAADEVAKRSSQNDNPYSPPVS